MRGLTTARPAAARVDDVAWHPIAAEALDGFGIAPSEPGLDRVVSIPPDLATCPECAGRNLRPGQPPLSLPVHQLHELRPALHHRPRRAVRPRRDVDGELPHVRRVPARVRRSSRDRRFHAQPNACPACGPRLRIVRAGRHARCDAGDPLARRSRGAERRPGRGGEGHRRVPPRLRRLVDDGVARLRARKHREEKPLAVMVRDAAAASAPRVTRRRRRGAARVGRAAHRARAGGSPARPLARGRRPGQPAGRRVPAVHAAPSPPARRRRAAARDDVGQPERRAHRLPRRRRARAACARSPTSSSCTTATS